MEYVKRDEDPRDYKVSFEKIREQLPQVETVIEVTQDGAGVDFASQAWKSPMNFLLAGESIDWK